MEQDLENRHSTDELRRLEEEIAFWREFVRKKQRVGDLEMVSKGQHALAHALRQRVLVLEEAGATVISFPGV